VRRALVAGSVIAATLLAPHARAEDGGDGIYGRLDNDLELRVQAGAAFAAGGPGLAASLSAVYVSTAGIYVHYTDALGKDAPRVTRSIAGGVHLQPFFIGRALTNLEHGPAFVDLLVDSFAFEVGTFWAQPRGGTLGSRPGLELALDVGLPLIGRATGPFLGVRTALRWRPEDFVAGAPGGVVDRGAVLSLTLGWHQGVRTHVVDAGDVRVE
jgi:hypothetical protein